MTSKRTTGTYQQLPPLDQFTLHALAVWQDDVSLSTFTKFLKEAQSIQPELWTESPKQTTVRQIVERLGEAGLVAIPTRSMSRISVIPESLDFCLQQAVLAGHFAQLDELVRQQKEMRPIAKTYDLLARLAFYRGDWDAFFFHCGKAKIAQNRVIILGLMESWDPQIFQDLPVLLQRETLQGTLTRSLSRGSASRDSVKQFKSLVLSDEPAAQVWSDLRVQWLTGAGDIEQLSKLAQSTSPVSELAAGCCAFLQGQWERAGAAFNEYVSTVGKADPKAGPILRDMAGLIQFLLILKEDSKKLPRALSTYHGLTKKHAGDVPEVVIEFAIQAAEYAVSMEATARKRLATKFEYTWERFPELTKVLIAHLWRWFVPDHPFSLVVDSERLIKKYQQHDLLWLAALCQDGQLLGKRASGEELQALGTLHREIGTFPLADWIEQQPIWKQKLEVLRRVANQQSGHLVSGDDPSPTADERMIWELDLRVRKERVGITNLRPMFQKWSGGSWSKGRPVALQRLHGRDAGRSFSFLSAQDLAICKCIDSYEQSSGRYTQTVYFLDTERAMEALVGHPLIFPPEERNQTLELVHREPELVIEKSASGYRLVLCPAPVGQNAIVLCPDGPNRFAMVRFTPAQSQLANVLGGGVVVPASGQAELLATAQALSHVAAVQSTGALVPVEGTSQSSSAEEDSSHSVLADSAPLVHLTPSQQGIRAEFFVRPFGAQGPLFSPGIGGQTIFAVIDQKRHVTQRDLQAEQQRAAEVISRCRSLAGAQETFVAAVDLPTAEQALELVSELEPLQKEGLVTVFWPKGETLRVAGHAASKQLRINLKSDKDWFAASGELFIDKQLSIDLVALADLICAKPSQFVPLKDGRFLRLSEQLRQRVAALAACSERRGNALRFAPMHAAAMEDMDQWCVLKAGKAWKDRQQRIREALETNFPLPSTLNATLRDYQTEGFQWLCRLAHWGAGACLADDMGLGKTLQAIALLLHRAAGGPALVVAPTSLGFNWESELYRFAPTLKAHIFGDGDRDSLLANLGPRDVVITSYGLLQSESQRFAAVDWHTVVLDEAQAIKNTSTKRSQAAMGLNATFRLILTGTPIENHLGELWNLMQFINPGLLGSSEQFQQRFAIPIERDQDREKGQQLKRLVQPFLLRRTKSQVLTELPSRTEVTLSVSLSDEEMLLYEAARQRAVAELAAATESRQGQHLRILAELMRLRRACCHPKLLLPDCDLPGSKLEAFSHTIDELLENQHKALVFSQFVDHLSILREELDRKGIDYQYLDGSTSAKERRRRVEAFQDGQGDVFLISLKAGGTGLNLTAADYVLHMDPWWNPAVEDQAADRAHRIGQQRPVTIYRFIARGTIEEKIVELHKHKRDLADSLLEGSDTTGRLNAEELLKLLQPM